LDKSHTTAKTVTLKGVWMASRWGYEGRGFEPWSQVTFDPGLPKNAQKNKINDFQPLDMINFARHSSKKPTWDSIG